MSSDPARDRRIVELTARGWTQRAIAAEVGCSERTIREVLARDGNRDLVAQLRAADNGPPDALSTLRAALNATRRDGSPDWPTRISAARALLAHTPKPETEPAKSAFVQVHFHYDEETGEYSIPSEETPADALPD